VIGRATPDPQKGPGESHQDRAGHPHRTGELNTSKKSLVVAKRKIKAKIIKGVVPGGGEKAGKVMVDSPEKKKEKRTKGGGNRKRPCV